MGKSRWGGGVWWYSIKGKTLVCTRRPNPGPWLGGVEDSKTLKAYHAGWGMGVGGGGVNWEKNSNQGPRLLKDKGTLS